MSDHERAWALEPDGSLRPLDCYDGPALAADRGLPPRFHVLAKPVGAACNLDCRYCFYLHKEDVPGGPGAGHMTEATLEAFTRQYLEGAGGPEVVFSWQGGEPTLRGLDFYRRAVELQRRYARPGQVVQNDLQTNGTLLDDAWCEFLRENRFLVGLSIDGPRELHDAYRVSRGGEPTFDRVLAAARLLREHGVPFNTLTCVHRLNARRPLDVYRFLRRELGSTHLQFIPVVEHRGFVGVPPPGGDPGRLPRQGEPAARPGHPDSVVEEWSVDPDDWGRFLCRTFDEWLARDVGKALVNHFESLVAQHLGLPPQICVYGETCGTAVALEHDGSVYSCDHYVYPEFRLGDVHAAELRDLVVARGQVRFGYAKSESLPRQCRECPHLADCRGECPKNRLLRTADGEPGLNYLCSGFQAYFAHAVPHVERLAADLRRRGVRPRPRA